MNETESSKKIFTIPNALSFLRLCMIPFFVAAYLDERYYLAFGVLVLSGLTDIIDGQIARRFHMISELGKALDPVADKCTQIAAAYCLTRRFPNMIYLLVLLVLKEVVTGISSVLVLKKTGSVYGAVWHGKVTTVLLYTVMLVHLFFPAIPHAYSDLSIGLCLGIMILSFVMYLIRNIRVLKTYKNSASAPSQEVQMTE